MTALVLAYAAGVLTTINPCVLPLLPVVLTTALLRGRFGPAVLALGLVAGFTTVGLAIGAAGAFLGLSEQHLRFVVASIFAGAGIVLLVPALDRRFAVALAPAGASGASLASRTADAGLPGQFAVGLLLGAIWVPCSGPTLGAALALAADAGGAAQAALRMAVFALGAASVLLLLSAGERALLARRREWLARATRMAKPLTGGAFLLVGLAVLSGLDKRAEAFLTEHAPEWLIVLTTSI
jgi:cytochrome c biogenesis protein CcdA